MHSQPHVRYRSKRRLRSSERLGGECGDTVTLDCVCMDESDEYESESRELQQNHDRRGENADRTMY